MRTTAYRVLGPGWGIAIDLTAASASSAAPPLNGERVSDRVWWTAAPVLGHPPADRTGLRLTTDEVGWLRYGLGLAAEGIRAVLPPGRHVLLTVHRVVFPETDFQEDGLAGAMAAWCREEFGIAHDPVGTVTFDRDANRFVYAWHERRPGQRATEARMKHPARDLCGRLLPQDGA